jgi:CheY-like chemotaxis protein
MTKRILVVDDEADVRRLAVMSLSRIGGYEVRSAGTALECLAALDEEMPDAIVLDVMLPGTDGPAILNAIRDRPDGRDVPVVFLTAGVVEADMDRLRVLPIAGILRKPFDPMQLPTELAGVLGW